MLETSILQLQSELQEMTETTLTGWEGDFFQAACQQAQQQAQEWLEEMDAKLLARKPSSPKSPSPSSRLWSLASCFFAVLESAFPFRSPSSSLTPRAISPTKLRYTRRARFFPQLLESVRRMLTPRSYHFFTSFFQPSSCDVFYTEYKGAITGAVAGLLHHALKQTELA